MDENTVSTDKKTEAEQSDQSGQERKAENKGFVKTVNGFVYQTGLVAAKTVAGVGVGAVAGIGAVVALSVAEVTLPALLVLKTFGFAGGAIGFLKGVSKKQVQ